MRCEPCPLCGTSDVYVVRKAGQLPKVVCLKVNCGCQAPLEAWNSRERLRRINGRQSG
jgi:hypothetical protein